jgi:enoyl-CoA hydratase
MSTFEHIIVESQGAVGIIRLNRPKMLNALSFGVFREIAAAVDSLEADDGVGCIVVTGNETSTCSRATLHRTAATGSPDAASQRSLRSRAMRSAAAASSQ